MIHKFKKNGLETTIYDGDDLTADIVELHDELADEADKELVQFALKILRKRGWKCFPPITEY